MCSVFGPSGRLCLLTDRLCLAPEVLCTDFSMHFSMHTGGRQRMSTALAVVSQAITVKRYVASSVKTMRANGYDKRPGYAPMYEIMEDTRKQSVGVSDIGSRALESIPATASRVRRELVSIMREAEALLRHYEEDAGAILQFVESLDQAMTCITDALEEEMSIGDEFYQELLLLSLHGDHLLDHLDQFIDPADRMRLSRRSKVLAPFNVTPHDRVAGGVASMVAAGTIAYAACAVIPPLAVFYVPATSVLAGTFFWFSHKEARRLDEQYYQQGLVNDRVEDEVRMLKHSLPGHLESVKRANEGISKVIDHLKSARDAAGHAETTRLKMVENRLATSPKYWMNIFIRAIDEAIKDMEGVSKLGIVARKSSLDFRSSQDSREVYTL